MALAALAGVRIPVNPVGDMISTEENTQQLSDKIYNVSSIDELRQIVFDMRRRGGTETEPGRLDDLLPLAFLTARRLTAESPQKAEPLIIDELLPLCLQPKEERSDGRGHNPFPEILRSWLDELPERNRFGTRRQILSVAEIELGGARIREALILIHTIAYRDPSVVRALRIAIKARDDEIGDLALATLVNFGVPRGCKEKLISELIRRIRLRWKDPLVAVAKGLPDVRVLEAIHHHWLAPERLQNEDAAKSWLPRVSIPLIAMIANAFPTDISLQYLAWKRLRSLRSVVPQLLRSVLLYDNRFTRIDSPEVVRFHLKSLGEEDPSARYLSYTRLKECVLPHQLDGWARRVPETTLRVLADDSCAVTGMEGPYSTRGLEQKTQAWSVLLSLGRINRRSFDRASGRAKRVRYLEDLGHRGLLAE